MFIAKLQIILEAFTLLHEIFCDSFVHLQKRVY